MAAKATLVAASITREKEKAEKRSPKWPAARDRFLKKNPTCAACGCSSHIQVHHVVPFHEDHASECDPANFISLCATNLCHARIGHGGNFKCYAPNVRELAAKVLSGEISRTTAAAMAKAARRVNDGNLNT